MRLLIEETRDKYPAEACGLLLGKNDDKEAVVKRVKPLRNTLSSPSYFRIDPEEFLKELSEAEKNSVYLIGFFHSHPALPNPSLTDVEYMKLWPESIWLIISSINYDVAACRISNDQPVKVTVKINGNT